MWERRDLSKREGDFIWLYDIDQVKARLSITARLKFESSKIVSEAANSFRG